MDTSIMTVREVASYLHVDEKTIYRLASKRKLPGFKVAGTWRFKKDDIDAWIEHQKKSVPKSDSKLANTIRRKKG